MAYQEHYTQQLLDNLRAKLLIMGSKTQQALDDAAIAVLNHDLPRAAAVLDGDTDIDDLENQIDEATLNILARTQPVARDLRFLMSVVRMVLDLERIGDESVVVAEQVTLSDKPIPSIVEKDLRALCTRTSAMLRNSCSPSRTETPQRPCVSRYDDETAQMMVNIFQSSCRPSATARLNRGTPCISC
ncbi:MAG: phosphate signaling complex PhoU family protein [Bilophila wadsworthia]